MRKMMWAACVLAATTAGTASANWPQFMGPTADGVAPAAEEISKSFPAEGQKELWKIPMAEGFGAPAVVDGKVYVLDRPDGGAKEVFSVINLTTGNVEWTVENPTGKFPDQGKFGTTRSTPTIDGTMAYTIGTT